MQETQSKFILLYDRERQESNPEFKKVVDDLKLPGFRLEIRFGIIQIVHTGQKDDFVIVTVVETTGFYYNKYANLKSSTNYKQMTMELFGRTVSIFVDDEVQVRIPGTKIESGDWTEYLKINYDCYI